MGNRKSIKLYHPKFTIIRDSQFNIFIDTFMWSEIINNEEYEKIKGMLSQCCHENKIRILITNILKGELDNRNLLNCIIDICNDSIEFIPIGRIAANQIIQSMTRYFLGEKNVNLSWDLAVSKVPVLNPTDINLKDNIIKLTANINKSKKSSKTKAKSFVSAFVHIERKFWVKTLKSYWECLIENSTKQERSYEEFYYSDYYTDLPSIVLRCYLFGYILKERKLKVQDTIDVYNISEILPYTNLSIIDKDQYNRLIRLKRDFPPLFSSLFEYVKISSPHSEAPSPKDSLTSFLNHCMS